MKTEERKEKKEKKREGKRIQSAFPRCFLKLRQFAAAAVESCWLSSALGPYKPGTETPTNRK